MKAMIMTGVSDLMINTKPLSEGNIDIPKPAENQILIKISTCGVCHTELDEIEGRTPPESFPRIPGHQAVGTVEDKGSAVTTHKIGDRVGVAWIFSSCGTCEHCLRGNDNLCDQFKATGRDADGGYAEYMVIGESFAYPIPESFSDTEAAPLLCAGAIGYRSLRLTDIEVGQKLGLTGFGGSAHLVLQMMRHKMPDNEVYVFARNEEEREFAKSLGAVWAGDTSDESPAKLDAIIDTTPVWKPVVEAMNNLDKGGRLVINAIRKEEQDKEYLLKLEYEKHLWMEKEIKSVANVSRSDVTGFLKIAADIGIKPEIEEYALTDANQALVDLKNKKIKGSKVLVI